VLSASACWASVSRWSPARRRPAVLEPGHRGILAVTALILLATTYLTVRAAKGQETTYVPTGPDGPGSARIGSVPPLS
jgi:hypothetical protein